MKRDRPFKTLFKSNKEELEILNSFQNFIFINEVPPGPNPSPLATPLASLLEAAGSTICFLRVIQCCLYHLNRVFDMHFIGF